MLSGRRDFIRKSVGVASWLFPQWMQDAFDVDSFLPELTMDGVNERGVAINVNVVPGGDNGWTTYTNPKATEHTLHAMGIERYANVSNGLESVEPVDEMYTHMTIVWYKPKYLPDNELKYWSDLNGSPVPGKDGVRFAFGDETIAGQYDDRLKAFKQIQATYEEVLD